MLGVRRIKAGLASRALVSLPAYAAVAEKLMGGAAQTDNRDAK